MRVDLTETQRQLRDTVRAFAAERIRPAAEKVDREARVPRELVAALGDLGVLGCFVPERYGGAGFDQVAYALAVEEVSAACASTGAVLGAHGSLATWPILAFGSEEQRARWLPPLVRGEWLGCGTLSTAPEEAGLMARRSGAHYVLDGTVHVACNAADARLAVVVAALDAGAAAFVVETGSPGWEVAPSEAKMGLCGTSSARIACRDVRVPRANLLGAESAGLEVASRTLDGARIASAAQAVGIARAALDASLVYARERRVFGQPIAEFQGAQWRLADMATAVEAARLLTLRAAFLQDRGLPYTKEAAMAKLYAAETAMTLATQGVQMHGGYGYTREFPVERHFRDAQGTQIAAGTSDVQRLAIAAELIGGAE